MSNNPLLDHTGLPAFDEIKPKHVEAAIDEVLKSNRETIDQLLKTSTSNYSWQNLAQPVEELGVKLARTWSPASHMNSVVNSEALRLAYNACLPKISVYSTEVGQNEALFQAYKSIAESDEYERLNHAQRKVIDNTLRDFRLSGIALSADDKIRYKEIMQELSALHAKFDENLLDATKAWTRNISDKTQLTGLPDSAIAMAKQTAEREKQGGWLFTLEFPSYIAIMTYADSAALREEMYTAFVTRASDQGPNADKWDNTPIMERILALRHEEAQLLGFKNFAERSLATKMANDTQQVIDFLNDLAQQSATMGQQELDELKAFAKNQHGVDTLEAWDLMYYGEKLRQKKFAITQEELKPYFPESKVIAGLFAVVNRLYGLNIKQRSDVKTWHEDVHFFDIFDKQGELRGQFYLDLYARPNKRGGAWMDECIIRQRNHDNIETPVAYLTCNFSSPIGDQAAQFTHQEVITLFHEFGHGLHHMLTQIDYPGVSGINGVAWDAVELPSQFMENWCWEKEALSLFSGHYQTGEPLPDEMFEKLLAAKNFQSGMQMLRQLELSLFDFRLHLEYDPKTAPCIYSILDEVRAQIAVVQPPSFNRFPHSFSHIFAGGYAAGYYSYKWAEVLSSDAFSLFEEKGIFDTDTGIRFLSAILEQGGSREPMELFVEFRGREPQIDALLRHSGINA